jgi:hypothetical protein
MPLLCATNSTFRETDMSKNFKQWMIHGLALTALAAGAATSADAAIWVRSRVVVRPVVAAPVLVAPVTATVVAAPVVTMPVVAAPVVAAPVVVAPVVVAPVCNVVSVPVANALTGVTFLVPRRVCN